MTRRREGDEWKGDDGWNLWDEFRAGEEWKGDDPSTEAIVKRHRMHWILDENKAPVLATFEEWMHWFEGEKNRVVAQTTIEGFIVKKKGGFVYDENGKVINYEPREYEGALISTIFLGIDHGFSMDPKAKPVLFETMIFGGPLSDYQERYCTWSEAEAGHEKALKLAQEAFDELKKLTGEKDAEGTG